MHRYSPEQKNFVINNNYGKHSYELAELFNKEFGTNITPQEIKYFRCNNHLSSGLNGQFKKGHITHNKGKKWNDYMTKDKQDKARTTTFKKGNRPKNYRPIGSERITIDGYIEIKIDDPNKWQPKHRYIYGKEYGYIPDNCNIIFLDGNRKNLEISNLRAVTKAEDLIMNNNKLFTNKKEITSTGHLIAKVIDKTNKVKNGK